jgi:tellurite resistance protein TerC
VTPSVLAAGEGRLTGTHFAVEPWIWGLFLAFIMTLLVLDLLVIHRRPHVISLKEAAIESAVWISIGLSFTFVVWWWQGGTVATEYVSGYLIEQSLSIDNVFVWAVIFSFFAVPPQYQFRTLFWGVFGALVLRAAFIFGGVALLENFHAVVYVFGVLLLATAWRIGRHDEAEIDPDRNLALRAVRKVVPSTNDYDGQKLFTRRNGKRVATPLFAVLVMVETTDLVFAIDSIPAILAITSEQFIVLSSNAFAILGLRSLYFLVSGMADRFRYLNVGLAFILAFVGIKFLVIDLVHVPTAASLGVIAVILTITIGLSLRAERRDALTPAEIAEAQRHKR